MSVFVGFFQDTGLGRTSTRLTRRQAGRREPPTEVVSRAGARRATCPVCQRHPCLGQSARGGRRRTVPGRAAGPGLCARAPWPVVLGLLDDLGDATRTDGAATLADGEAHALVHRDRLDEVDL